MNRKQKLLTQALIEQLQNEVDVELWTWGIDNMKVRALVHIEDARQVGYTDVQGLLEAVLQLNPMLTSDQARKTAREVYEEAIKLLKEKLIKA